MRARFIIWLLGLVVLASTMSTVTAQKSSVFQGGFNPQPHQNTPIDMNKLVAPLPPQQPKKPFSLKNLVPSFMLPGSNQPTSKKAGSPTNTTPNTAAFQPQKPFVPGR